MRSIATLALVGMAATSSACGAKQTPQETRPSVEGSIAERTNLEERERCVIPGRAVQEVDVNGDGTPNVRHASEGERRVCSELDLDFDGVMDVTRFYAEDGETPVREEYDYDFDGRIDEVVHHLGDGRVKRDLDTSFDHRVDTWVLCRDGLVLRVERDRRRRGLPDVFEEYEDGYLTVAAYDEDLDGKPERFEFFEEGRIVATGLDTTGDGEADERTRVPIESAGPALERALCEGSHREPSE